MWTDIFFFPFNYFVRRWAEQQREKGRHEGGRKSDLSGDPTTLMFFLLFSSSSSLSRLCPFHVFIPLTGRIRSISCSHPLRVYRRAPRSAFSVDQHHPHLVFLYRHCAEALDSVGRREGSFLDRIDDIMVG